MKPGTRCLRGRSACFSAPPTVVVAAAALLQREADERRFEVAAKSRAAGGYGRSARRVRNGAGHVREAIGGDSRRTTRGRPYTSIAEH